MTNSMYDHPQLVNYRREIDTALEEYCKSLTPQSKVSEALSYAVLGKAKRFRPIIVLMIKDAIGKGFNVIDSACAVELFHTSSLVADDLPCMDDDAMRRGKPSTHVVYGEDIAIMSSYLMIAEGYKLIAKNGSILSSASDKGYESFDILEQAIISASNNMGINGIVTGQFYDLHPNELSPQFLEDIIAYKTIPLFELSFILGWMFGGGELLHLGLLKRLAFHFGMIFQLVDDFDDYEHDKQVPKTSNYVVHVGKERAIKKIHESMYSFKELCKELSLKEGIFSFIMEYSENFISKNI